MLSRIEVKNFQSLRDVTIRLGKFTVITGPTGSGKSALFRAWELLARNARGTNYISTGENTCSVAAGNDDWAVRITRSRPPGKRNEYAVARRADGAWSSDRYTKLGGQVPEPAEELLALTELNFATQFHMPFLVSEPGTVIARRLGDLTNVSLVFEAAASTNRVRKQLARDLDSARQRRDDLLAEAQEFAGLGDRRKAITAAEEALSRLQATSAELDRLRVLTDRLEAAERAAAEARAEAARQAPPSLEHLETMANDLERLRTLTDELEQAEQGMARCAADAGRAYRDEQAAHEALHAALVSAGQCPTCGSTISS